MQLFIHPQDLDDIEDLWVDWYEETDRLSRSLDLMRRSLTEAFDPVARPGSWRRHDQGTRLSNAIGTCDSELIGNCLDRIAAMPEKQRTELLRCASPRTGDTALHDAAWRRNLHVARKLIEMGAETDIPNNSGRSPLWL